MCEIPYQQITLILHQMPAVLLCSVINMHNFILMFPSSVLLFQFYNKLDKVDIITTFNLISKAIESNILFSMYIDLKWLTKYLRQYFEIVSYANLNHHYAAVHISILRWWCLLLILYFHNYNILKQGI